MGVRVIEAYLYAEKVIIGSKHGQADPGTLASDNGSDNTDSQVVLGVANVHEDAVLL